MNPMMEENFFDSLDFPNRKNQNWRFSDLKGWSAESAKSLVDIQNAPSDAVVSASAVKLLNALKNSFDGFESIFCADGEIAVSGVRGLKVGDFKGFLDDTQKDAFYAFAKSRGAYGKIFEKLNASSENLVIDAPAGARGKILVLWDSSEFQTLGVDIRAAANSRIEICMADFSPKAGLYLRETLLDLGKNAEVSLSMLSQSAKDARVFDMLSANLSEGALLSGAAVCAQNANIRREAQINLLGAGADAHFSFLQNAVENNWQDLRTWQLHKSGGATSRIDVKNILDNSSRASFIGEIIVGKTAQKTRAYQSCRTLQLSTTARVDASPILEIEANDVECSHGCAVSGPDKDELFYMACRGLAPREAKALQVGGFALSVLEKIPSEDFRAFVSAAL